MTSRAPRSSRRCRTRRTTHPRRPRPAPRPGRRRRAATSRRCSRSRWRASQRPSRRTNVADLRHRSATRAAARGAVRRVHAGPTIHPGIARLSPPARRGPIREPSRRSATRSRRRAARSSAGVGGEFGGVGGDQVVLGGGGDGVEGDPVAPGGQQRLPAVGREQERAFPVGQPEQCGDGVDGLRGLAEQDLGGGVGDHRPARGRCPAGRRCPGWRWSARPSVCARLWPARSRNCGAGGLLHAAATPRRPRPAAASRSVGSVTWAQIASRVSRVPTGRSCSGSSRSAPHHQVRVGAVVVGPANSSAERAVGERVQQRGQPRGRVPPRRVAAVTPVPATVATGRRLAPVARGRPGVGVGDARRVARRSASSGAGRVQVARVVGDPGARCRWR